MRQGGDVAFDLADIAHINWDRFHPERWRRGLDGAELPDPGGYGGVPKDGHSFHPRRDLLEHLQPFPAQAVFEHEEASGVAARPRQARNETGTDRVNNK